jgi:hypothetical protein
VCSAYREWLRGERGLADASVDDLMGEARHFLSWYTERSGAIGFMQLGIGDVDAYFEMRAPGLRRRSLKDVAERRAPSCGTFIARAVPRPIWHRRS